MINKIKEIRIDNEITQAEFANLCKVGVQTISDLENFHRKTINDNVLTTLDKMGYDKTEVLELYKNQREEKREKMKKSMYYSS